MTLPYLLAYVGPDTFLPLTSALSALAGVAMFLWGTGMRSIMRRFGTRGPRGAHTPAPKLNLRRRSKVRTAATETNDPPPTVRD